MYHSSRHTIGTAFTLGIGAGILMSTLLKKLPVSVNFFQLSHEQKNKSLKLRIQNLKSLSENLYVNPIPDLYKATDSLTLSEEDLIHASS